MFTPLAYTQVNAAVSKHMNTPVGLTDLIVNAIVAGSQHGEEFVRTYFSEAASLVDNADPDYPKFYTDLATVYAELYSVEFAREVAEQWKTVFILK